MEEYSYILVARGECTIERFLNIYIGDISPLLNVGLNYSIGKERKEMLRERRYVVGCVP